MWQHHRVRFTLRDHCWPALLMVCLLHWPLSTPALGETRHVLVLSSSERPHAPQSGFTDALVRELIRSTREPIQFVEIPVQAARAQHNVTIHFHDESVPRDLSSDVALALFRVLQEATVNAVVHSQAREVRVSMRGTPDEVRLQIVDHGCFDTQRGVSGIGVGLVAIRERIELVNGDSVIVSSPGQGTCVEAWVPLAPVA